jgi:predicted RNA binding protein YcfA (HicA-like mRNA interferase family)
MQARRAFERCGWVFKRWHGSHMILGKPGSFTTLSVPDHRELDRGMLRGLIRTAQMSVEDFIAALKQ